MGIQYQRRTAMMTQTDPTNPNNCKGCGECQMECRCMGFLVPVNTSTNFNSYWYNNELEV